MSLLRSYSKFFPQVQLIRRFSSEKPWQEVSIPVPWGQIRGKWWGPTDIRPILTLHGWQDNCGSLDRLIPLLNENVGYLAIDLPGHGLSSRLPVGIFYHFEAYVITLRCVANYFQWPKTSLVGHSMGGATAYVYTMLYPQSVDFLGCIDSGKPVVERTRSKFMTGYIDQFLKTNKFAASSVEPPSYTWEDIRHKLHAPHKNSIAFESTEYIMERNVAPSKIYPGKYYFTRDPRLKVTEVFSIQIPEVLENSQYITCPVFLIKVLEAAYANIREDFYDVVDVLKRSSAECDFHTLKGTHHQHLNNPEDIAGLLRNFIQKHNVEDRSVGGLRSECIVTEDQDPRIKGIRQTL